jgi:hypothetical protein
VDGTDVSACGLFADRAVARLNKSAVAECAVPFKPESNKKGAFCAMHMSQPIATEMRGVN